MLALSRYMSSLRVSAPMRILTLFSRVTPTNIITIMINLLEDLAAQTLYDLSIATPTDAFDLARAMGFRVQLVDADVAFRLPATSTIAVPARMASKKKQAVIAALCADFLLIANDLEDEKLVHRLAAALLVPTGALRRAIGRFGVAKRPLQAEFPNVSAGLLARRCAEVTGRAYLLWNPSGRAQTSCSVLQQIVGISRATKCDVGPVWYLRDGFCASIGSADGTSHQSRCTPRLGSAFLESRAL